VFVCECFLRKREGEGRGRERERERGGARARNFFNEKRSSLEQMRMPRCECALCESEVERNIGR
jgi:hypothetical protein